MQIRMVKLKDVSVSPNYYAIVGQWNMKISLNLNGGAYSIANMIMAWIYVKG